MEHKRALEINDDKIKSYLKLLTKESRSEFYKINTKVTPGSLNFYIDALKFVSKCRSFIVYTYPIGFKILDSNQADLFAQSQYYLEYSLEVFDKNLIKQGWNNLCEENVSGPCLSKDFSDIKANIINLQIKLGEQFKNAKKEFSDRDYLMMI